MAMLSVENVHARDLYIISNFKIGEALVKSTTGFLCVCLGDGANTYRFNDEGVLLMGAIHLIQHGIELRIDLEKSVDVAVLLRPHSNDCSSHRGALVQRLQAASIVDVLPEPGVTVSGWRRSSYFNHRSEQHLIECYETEGCDGDDLCQ